MLADDGTLACDWCSFANVSCPGQRAHCKAGYHCIAMEASCNGSNNMHDHGPRCCECKMVMPATRH